MRNPDVSVRFARRDGEVQLLHPAHCRGRKDRRRTRKTARFAMAMSLPPVSRPARLLPSRSATSTIKNSKVAKAKAEERDYPGSLRPELPSTYDVHSWRHQPESGAGINGYEESNCRSHDRPAHRRVRSRSRRAITSSQSRRRLAGHRPHVEHAAGLVLRPYRRCRCRARRDHRHHLALSQGRGHLGRYDSRCVGIRHHQLRLVDRYRPRRER